MNWSKIIKSTKKHKLFEPKKVNTPLIANFNPEDSLKEAIGIVYKWSNERPLAPENVKNYYQNGALNVNDSKLKYNLFMKKVLENKQPIMDKLFNGKIKLNKTLKIKENAKVDYIGLSQLTDIVYQWDRTPKAYFATFLGSGYEEINILANKIKIGGQWRKLSKEFRKFMLNAGVRESVADLTVQKLSTIFSSSKEEEVVWSVDPADFMIQSSGNTWTSCHRTLAKSSYKLTYHHKNHPWISQGLDYVSTIAYIKDKATGLLKARQAVYVDTKNMVAVIGRSYPNKEAPYKPLLKFLTYKLRAKGFKIKGVYLYSPIESGVFTMYEDGYYSGYNDVKEFDDVDWREDNSIYGYDESWLKGVLCN